ncbi:uncharacterized protein LOC126729037 [Quercus robur]|uniref:uncharacterized protein LOC126729037 n=1 Tax=Quercus robur TaxID=38942 RepID=UPI0021618DD9|nr:uncharacterized protein LOC126729037 [Quercus robur]
MASNNYSREELRRKILETRSHRVPLTNDDNVNTTFLHSPPPPPPPPPPSPASSTSSSSSTSSARQPFRVTHTKSSPSSFFPINVHDPDHHISASPLHNQSNAEPEGEDDATDSSEDVQIALDDMMKVQPSLDTSVQRIAIDKDPSQLSPNE